MNSKEFAELVKQYSTDAKLLQSKIIDRWGFTPTIEFCISLVLFVYGKEKEELNETRIS